MAPIFFSTKEDFRKWLEENHSKEKEILVGFYKKNSGKPSLNWSESVDQALCFGWIDGVRRSIDAESYYNRFTPRKPNSNWSIINIKKVEELTKAGLMTPEGQKAFEARKEDKTGIYSHEKELILDSAYEKAFKTHPNAWEFFEKQAASYKRTIIHWLMSAQQEKTRQSRLEKVINESEHSRRIK
ncbi:bacteriocin-protection protein [Chryseobacterium carnipullorum]|uniref:Bacteriocin-protection protein n=1 Tax=Chryseobacterium carnipullorum TaxID=1124835 RepID=A0A3G6NDG2_CHRCU|nr:YdeI/OmpD-associated family protein [Chryseobacterium carnipullorum]AZA46768.1 bacteriocin-protection protein [Chryseobacterium carnipullorum]AZA66130.1 bacteriocin-protection protein [Chryseobacterium carnipullorum]